MQQPFLSGSDPLPFNYLFLFLILSSRELFVKLAPRLTSGMRRDHEVHTQAKKAKAQVASDSESAVPGWGTVPRDALTGSDL